jgi:glycosyltransferase involved in cell wall biosynthesis
MFRPLVSIVIPVYNGANYLREAIDSALAQAYDNYEVLVINDGSADDGATESIALSYGKKIRYFAKTNGGVASALNLGIREMRGEYFSWLSHDDLYFPEKLQRQIEYLASLPDKNVLLFSDYITIDEQGKKIALYRADHERIAQQPLYAVFGLMIHGCSCLVKKDALVRVGLFRELPNTQDYDLWFRLSRQLPLCHMAEPLICSRVHAKQGSKTRAALTEADRLWLRLFSELTREEILRTESSRELFFSAMALYWRQNGMYYYPETVKFLYQQFPCGPLPRFTHYWQWQSKAILRNILSALGLLPYVRKLRTRLREKPHYAMGKLYLL